MNKTYLPIMMVISCLISVQPSLIGSNLILRAEEQGSGVCNGNLAINWNRANGQTSIDEVYTSTAKLILTIAEQPVEDNFIFPLKVKAFTNEGDYIGESDNIVRSSLIAPTNEAGLISGEIVVPIRLKVLLNFSQFICAVDSDGTVFTSYRVRFKIYRGEVELSENSDIFNHPALIPGTNKYSTGLAICGICLDNWKFKSNTNYSGSVTKGSLSNPANLSLASNNFIFGQDDVDGSGEVLNIYPNPAKHRFTIDIYEFEIENISVIITSHVGNKKFVGHYQNQPSITLNISEFPPGNYYVLVKTSKRIVIRKLVIYD